MTNKLTSLLKWIFVSGAICLFLVLPEIWIAKLIAQNDQEYFKTCLTIMLILTLIVYLIIAVVKIVQYQKWFKKYTHETLEEAAKRLSLEFKNVLLNSSADIPKEKFECQAKVDSKGKIICKIHVDFETKMDSYEKFLRYFHFNED